jgi:L-Ala-D/L-Glu epimerase
MKLSFQSYLLALKYPFGVSSNIRTHTPAVYVRIAHQGEFGYGEACLPKYLGETTEETIRFLSFAKKILDGYEMLPDRNELLAELDQISDSNFAAKAAIDVALADLSGKLANLPFYSLAGIGKSDSMHTSCTIGIDDAKIIAKKIAEAKDFSILKIKAGTNDDKALIELVREHSDKPLYVDINQGWQDKYFVLEMIHWLKEKNVVLVEQPMPVNQIDEMAWVTERSPLPTIADESVKRLKDIQQQKGVFSGINIKLMKSAGITEALEMALFARENNLKVMLGCMAESSCATSAMAQIMKLGDYIDLDAPQLISNDPFEGVAYHQGKVVLNNLPGIGVKLRGELLNFD